MIRDAIAAYAHYLAILATAILIGAEALIYRKYLTQTYVKVLQRLDLYYLFAAIALILTGIGRIFASPQGWPFFAHNPIFWTKMALFATLGILSIWPTRHFVGWNKSAAADGSVTVDAANYARIRTILIAEVCVLFAIPLFASLMARGIGLH